MTKIVIAGIGGVGGYFGGLLAKKYRKKSEIDIIFLSRGEHLKQIKKNGLKLIKGKEEFVVFPELATDNAKEIGIADFIIICTKSYDLEATIEQLKPCIDNDTLLLPLLNGVDASERIQKLLPYNSVLKGCVYIVSHVKEPGVVENSGNIQKLFFGLDNEINQDLLFLEDILENAGIEVTLSEEISNIVWQKFIFVSPIAATTTYFDSNIGEVVEKNETILIKLIDEVSKVAKAKGIILDKGVKENSLSLIKSLPSEISSSMHRDFKNGKANTEIESLLGFVVKAGKELHIETPAYDKVYLALSKRK